MMKPTVFFVALALAAQGALAHTYFKAELVGNPSKNITASGALEFMTHAGVAFYELNVTGIEGMTAAKLVFGNASLSSEPVASFLEIEAVDGTLSWQGEFQADNFTAEYPITMTGLQAHAGLGHIWAVVTNAASYSNNLLLGQLQIVPYDAIQSYWVQEGHME